jgi:hypothetical protein
MITLAAQDVTSTTTVFNEVPTTTITDTLYVSYVEISFSSGSVMTILQRGTTQNGTFVPILPDLRVQLNPDGTFSSTNGVWKGVTSQQPVLMATLKTVFDSFILGAGEISGVKA